MSKIYIFNNFFPENNQVCFKCVYGNIIEIHYRNNRTNSLKPGNNLKKLILWLSFEQHLYQISLKVKYWPLKNINSFSRETSWKFELEGRSEKELNFYLQELKCLIFLLNNTRFNQKSCLKWEQTLKETGRGCL